MLTVDAIVKVNITRETSSKTVRDLQTIAVLSKHSVFTEASRTYTSTTEMLVDGFKTTDFAYIAVSNILSQNPQVSQVVVGKVTTEDYVEEIKNLQASNNNWFFLVTDAKDIPTQTAIATYVETQIMFYLFSSSDVNVLDSTQSSDIFSVLGALSFTQSAGIFVRDATVVAPESAWAGRHASVVIGSNLWIYKTIVGLVPESFSTTEVNSLNKKNAQYYTKVGSDSVIVGNATVVGGEKIHVILGAIWLQVRVGERLWNLLYTKERILYINAGVDLFKAELVTVLNEAVTNNILTADEGFNITIPDANKLTSAQRASGVLSGITFRAKLAGAIIFVNAIQGTIFE